MCAHSCHVGSSDPKTIRDGKVPFATNITYALKVITISESKEDINNINNYNSSAGPGDAPPP